MIPKCPKCEGLTKDGCQEAYEYYECLDCGHRFQDKDIKVNNVVNMLHDTNTHALECKKEFGNEYDNYCSYLEQLQETVDGKITKWIPVSYGVYMELSEEDDVVNVLHHSNTDALKDKEVFGNNYDWYCSYLEQFVETTDGRKTKWIPVSYDVYMRLGESTRKPSDKECKEMLRIKQICKRIDADFESDKLTITKANEVIWIDKYIKDDLKEDD